MKSGIELIAKERKTSDEVINALNREGHLTSNSQIVLMAVTYALPDKDYGTGANSCKLKLTRMHFWPWHQSWFSKHNRIKELAKAGALIAAEIDRLQNQKP